MIDILSWHSMNKTIWDSKYITVVVGGGGGGGRGEGGGGAGWDPRVYSAGLVMAM